MCNAILANWKLLDGAELKLVDNPIAMDLKTTDANGFDIYLLQHINGQWAIVMEYLDSVHFDFKMESLPKATDTFTNVTRFTFFSRKKERISTISL